MKRDLRYTSLAERDLDNILLYTKSQWGAAQASRYLDELEECCERIAGNPRMGRNCDTIHKGMRRIEQGSHVIFFSGEDEYLLVVRILHRSMVPALHEFAE